MGKLTHMFTRIILGYGLLATGSLWAQSAPAQVELANLREDVRGLVQRVGELSLRLEQLERENRELLGNAGAASHNYATVTQLNNTVVDLNRVIKTSTAEAKAETLQQVSVQLKELGRQTNAAIDSLGRNQPAHVAPTASPAPNEDYPKEGISYTVQRGDTLALIAKKTGAKQQDIVNGNKLADPSRIQVGQTLFIPGVK